MRARWSLVMLGAAAGILAAETPPRAGSSEWTLRALPSPAPLGSAQPYLAPDPQGGVWLTWIEKRPRGGHRLRASRLRAGRWDAARTIAEGDAFFVNWADVPGILATGRGVLTAFWLEQRPGGEYAYDVRIARSTDDGRTWSAPVVPHRDGTPTEHGFVSLVPEGAGVRVVWLDGRDAARKGAAGEHGSSETALMTALLGPDGALGPEEVLDPRVCDCCNTAGVQGVGGAVVAYRDRSPSEVRDIAVLVHGSDGWSEPAILGPDRWTIRGCPVNGPALDARGGRIAAAWFAAPEDSGRVQVAFAEGAGARFGPPQRIDRGRPLGRVDLALMPDGAAAVAWMESEGEDARILLRTVDPTGRAGAPFDVARSASKRASGFPRLALDGRRLYAAWTEAGDPSRVRVAQLDRNAATGSRR